MDNKGDKVKHLIRNSSWFFMVDIASRGLALLLVPLYTAYMSPVDYGIVAISLTITSIIGGINGFGLLNFGDRILYRFIGKRDRLGILLGNVYTFAFVLILLTAITLSLFPQLIHKTFFDNSELPSAIILFIPIWLSFFRMVSETLSGYQVISQLGKQCFFFSITKNISLHTLKIVALVALKLGVVGFLMAELITEVLIAISSTIMLWYMVRPKIVLRRRNIIKMGFRYGLPFIPNNISSWVVNYIDRIILLKLSGMWDVGIYSFAMSFATSLFNVLWNPIRSGMIPELPRQLDRPHEYPDAHKNIIEFLYASIIFLSMIMMGICLFGKEIIYILANRRYHSSYTLLPLFTLYLVFQNVREIFQFPIMIRNKTVFFPFNTFLGAALQIISNLILVPVFGIMGAAISTVGVNFILLLSALIYAQRLIFIRYDFITASTPLIISSALIGLSLWVHLPVAISVTSKITVGVLFLMFCRYFLARHCPKIFDSLAQIITENERIKQIKIIKSIASIIFPRPELLKI